MAGDYGPVRPGPKNPPPRVRERPYLVQPKLPPGQVRPGQRVVPPAPRAPRPAPKPQSSMTGPGMLERRVLAARQGQTPVSPMQRPNAVLMFPQLGF